MVNMIVPPSEHFLFYFRQHWIRLFWPTLRMLAVSIIAGLIAHLGLPLLYERGDPARHVVLAFLVLLVLAVHFDFLKRFYRHFLHVIVVTDRRIYRIHKYLISRDDHKSVDFASVQEMHKMQHGVVQNLFGFGTIVLEAQETEFRLHFVPHIASLYNRIALLRERALQHTYPMSYGNVAPPTRRPLEVVV